MFGLFSSEQKRARHDAANWLHLAEKIGHYRRDQLPQQELHAIQQAANELRNRLAEKADAAKLKIAMERLEGCLRRSGGTHYPKSAMVDNIEFFLVAAILFLGIRAFFVQPFKIPTNSMWPTYNGMTAEVYAAPGDEPGAIEKTFRFLAYGAVTRRVDAPADGEVMIALPIDSREQRMRFGLAVPSRRFGVFPGEAMEAYLVVGDAVATVQVPIDFDYLGVVRRAFPGMMQTTEHGTMWQQPVKFGEIDTPRGRLRVELHPTGTRVRAGERMLSFDVLTGDNLFVDRMSYHFIRPEVGDAFVFRTINIKGLSSDDPDGYLDRYYIKRLVGTEGDTLEVKAPVLYRNGAPITGAEAFDLNARQADRYAGYTNDGRLLKGGASLTIPEGRVFAMGDNSPNSADSRFWGFVPVDDIVGRPLFIYYPFTRRWGPAR